MTCHNQGLIIQLGIFGILLRLNGCEVWAPLVVRVPFDGAPSWVGKYWAGPECARSTLKGTHLLKYLKHPPPLAGTSSKQVQRKASSNERIGMGLVRGSIWDTIIEANDMQSLLSGGPMYTTELSEGRSTNSFLHKEA